MASFPARFGEKGHGKFSCDGNAETKESVYLTLSNDYRYQVLYRLRQRRIGQSGEMAIGNCTFSLFYRTMLSRGHL
jgi:hypothetical protein